LTIVVDGIVEINLVIIWASHCCCNLVTHSHASTVCSLISFAIIIADSQLMWHAFTDAVAFVQ